MHIPFLNYLSLEYVSIIIEIANKNVKLRCVVQNYLLLSMHWTAMIMVGGRFSIYIMGFVHISVRAYLYHSSKK